jgi:glycosyltransferase involved in cell wall biosynthesis
VSPAEGRLAVETGLFAPEQVRVLPNALDIDGFDRRIGVLRPIRRAPDARVFGLLGEIRAQKDPWTFVEAASRLRARGVPARFALLDQGPDLAKLKQRVKQQKLDSVVEFVKTKDSLDDLLRRIDVGVLPSLWEGLPYSALDVMAARRPLLASDLPVFQDLVGSIDTRLLFRAGNAEALADRMQLWSSLPPAEIQETGRRGRAVVQKQHDAGGWREDLRDLFRSLARR